MNEFQKQGSDGSQRESWVFPPANAGDIGDVGLIPGSGRSPGGGHATHSSVLAWRIPRDRGAWWAVVHGVTKGWT